MLHIQDQHIGSLQKNDKGLFACGLCSARSGQKRKLWALTAHVEQHLMIGVLALSSFTYLM